MAYFSVPAEFSFPSKFQLLAKGCSLYAGQLIEYCLICLITSLMNSDAEGKICQTDRRFVTGGLTLFT